MHSGNSINRMPDVSCCRKSVIVPGQHIRKIHALVVFFITCSLLTGPVSAGQFNQLFSGATTSGCCYDPCLDQNQSLCLFGGTCGDRVTMISLGTTGAHFAGTPTSGPAPLRVQFSTSSGPEITSFSWDFGDGAFGSGMNPAHTYTKPGTYTVKLTVRQGQANVNYQTSSYSSWGSESTWQKEDMIQVTGTESTGNMISTGTKGTLILATGITEEAVIEPDLSIQYPSSPLRKVQIPDFQRGILSQRATVLTSWKINSVKNRI